MQARLIGLQGPCLGLKANLSDGVTTIGRDADNTVVLNSQSVSRHHARIVNQGGQCIVEDLGSSNGLKLNGAPILGPMPLKNGDQLDFGGLILLFESPETTATASPRKPEVGSQERAAAYQKGNEFSMPHSTAGVAQGDGCNPFGTMMADIDGCLGAIMKYLPWLLLALALCCVFLIIVSGLGSLIGLGSQAAAGGGGAPAAPGGSPGSGGQGGQNSPPPPANNNSQEQQGSAKITILSTKVIDVANPDGTKTPTLLLKWRNDSDALVVELDGSVTIHTPDGRSTLYRNVKLYTGAAVNPNQTHEDTGTSDGAVIASDSDPKPEVTPTQVKSP